ncbi:class I SAM-dependent methyltransferase [Pseudogracilibacillus sp. SO30301A]|uniref:class I SAM-dependent methyltransferase n=1 Tax=Pseudogracilibacillus sp. SO30301A TaxID=3098291 RepID=UPI00300E65A8
MTKSFDWQKQTQKEWDNQASFWSERSKNVWDLGSRKDIIPFIQNHFKPGLKIIDIGCGDGYGTYKLKKSGYDATGIDISKKMVDLANQRFNDTGIRFQQGDVNQLPYSNNYYDGIMVINVLEWTDNPAKSLKEIKRILKINGIMCAGILGPTAGPRAHGYPKVYGKEVILNAMMPWDFLQLAKESGFQLLDSYGVYKKEVKDHHINGLSRQLKQALSFMWVFMLRKIEQ